MNQWTEQKLLTENSYNVFTKNWLEKLLLSFFSVSSELWRKFTS